MEARRIRRATTPAAVLTAIVLIGASLCSAADEQSDAVRAALAKFGQAFNNHDAASVAAAWTEDAVYIDSESGLELSGRQQIQEHYAQEFKAEPELKLSAKISEIELDGDTSAFVRGTAEVTGKAGDATITSFLAELVRERDQWLLLSVEESDLDQLSDLDWLIGDWKDEGTERNVQSKFAWDPGGRFLIRRYSIEDETGVRRRGTQFTTFDQASGRLRSWVFDSDGGFGEGVWTQHDDHWAIHWTGTLADGSQASATQVLRPVDEGSFTVQWTDIDVDGLLRPSTDVVTVRRVESTEASSGGGSNE